MSSVNILKQIKHEGRWKLISIPRDKQGRYQWKDLPEGRYFIEWWERGKRKRQAAGKTTADVLEAARRRKHILEGKALGIKGSDDDTDVSRIPLHIALKRYLDIVEGLKKPNTFRKYKSVLNRFLDFFPDKTKAESITPDDLNQFMVHLKRRYRLDNNTVRHNMIIVAQFLKRQGRPGLTKKIDLPGEVRSLPREYTDEELQSFFAACEEKEKTLFLTFLLTGFREQEVVCLRWDDINFKLSTVRVTAKADLGFSPKRWEEREVPVPNKLIEALQAYPHFKESRFVFPSPRGNRELHMLDKAKKIALRSKQDPSRFDLRKFRSTYATRMLRAGFDVRTVQHWMGHKSLETTMRYLAPAKDVHERLDKVQIAGVLENI